MYLIRFREGKDKAASLDLRDVIVQSPNQLNESIANGYLDVIFKFDKNCFFLI